MEESSEKKEPIEKPLEKEKTELKEETVKVEPYNVFGRDFSLTDPDYITYYKTRMKIMVVQYQLLGRVNDKGLYVINADIKRDLVNMDKEIDDMADDYYRAVATYMKKPYYFQVKITKNGENATASLYLAEFVDDFLEEEFIVTHIADYTDVYDEDFKVKVRKAFNLVDVAMPLSDFDIPNIAVVIQDAIDLEFLVGGLYDIASQIYLMRMLKLLEASGVKGEAIIRRYKELIADKDPKDFDGKNRNTKFKALLDRAIDEAGGLQALGLKQPNIRGAVKEINGSIKAIDGLQQQAGGLEVLKADKGKQKVAGAKAKSSSSSGGKKSAKKSATKSSAKKGGEKAKSSTSSSTNPLEWLADLADGDEKDKSSDSKINDKEDKNDNRENEVPTKEESKTEEKPILDNNIDEDEYAFLGETMKEDIQKETPDEYEDEFGTSPIEAEKLLDEYNERENSEEIVSVEDVLKIKDSEDNLLEDKEIAIETLVEKENEQQINIDTEYEMQ